MAKYTLEDIKALREKTGAGMLDVKNALAEADGDATKAEEILRLKGLKIAAKREGRSASAGLVASKIVDSAAGQTGYVVEVNAETDFVAKTQKFIDFSEEVLDAVVAAEATTVDEAMAAKIGNETVADKVSGMMGVIGEKIEVGSVHTLSGAHVSAYMHRTSTDLPPQVAVMVATDDAGEAVAHDVAVHIAAMAPRYLAEADVPEEEIENERRIATELTIAEGKPEKAVPKIVEGRLKGYFKQIVLLEQAYARDPKQTVGQVVKASGGNVTGFVRVRVGE